MSDITDKNELSGLTDSRLAEAVKEGNDLAFEVMSERYIKFISSLASGFSAGGFDRNDFIQEGLLILLAACKTYDENGGMTFRNYLSLCIRRRYISIQRRASAKGTIPQSSIISIDEAADSADYSQNPEEIVLNKEYISGILLAVKQKLSPLEQKILSHYLAGFTYKEIANKIGLSLKTVDNAIQRIKKKLDLSLGF